MEHHTRAVVQWPGLAHVAGRVWHLIFVVELALEVRRERLMLLSMDDRALKDIGFNRGKAYAEARRWFWDIPGDRLALEHDPESGNWFSEKIMLQQKARAG